VVVCSINEFTTHVSILICASLFRHFIIQHDVISLWRLSSDVSTNGTVSAKNMNSNTLTTDSTYERPRDPRDIKRSRAYQFDNSLSKDKSSTSALLDSSVLTPITNNDMLNGINVAGQRIDLSTASDEAAVSLADSSETADVTEMDMDIKPIFKIEDDEMELELPDKEHSAAENKMDTNNSASPKKKATNTSSLRTKGIHNSPIKSKLFSVSPDLDDDISLPSSKELSNQILLSNLRDIDDLSGSMDIQPLCSNQVSPKKGTSKKEAPSNGSDNKPSASNLSVAVTSIEKKSLLVSYECFCSCILVCVYFFINALPSFVPFLVITHLYWIVTSALKN